MKITWGEMLDRFGDKLSAAGFNPWAVKDGLATRETVQHISPDKAMRLGMSEQESMSRERLSIGIFSCVGFIFEIGSSG